MTQPSIFEETLKKLQAPDEEKPKPKEEKKDSFEDEFGIDTKPKKPDDDKPVSRIGSRTLGGSKFAKETKKPLVLDTGVSERVDLEDMFIDLKRVAREKRETFYAKCEEQELKRLKLERRVNMIQKPSFATSTTTNKDSSPTTLEKTGCFLLEDFVEVLKECGFRNTDTQKIRSLAVAINCLSVRKVSKDSITTKDVINYMKAIRQTVRLKRDLKLNENTFQAYRPTRKFTTESESGQFIADTYKILKKRTAEKKAKKIKKLEKKYDQVNIEELMKDPQKVLNILKEKAKNAPKPLGEVFKMFDINGDGKITFEEFKEAMLQTGIDFKDEVLKEVFRRFDRDDSGEITSQEFMGTILGEENLGLFEFLEKAQGNLEKIKQLLSGKFRTYEAMVQKMGLRQENRVYESEFKLFILTLTPEYNRLELGDVFRVLDKGMKGYLDEKEMKELWRPPVIKPEEKTNEEEEKKQKLREDFKKRAEDKEFEETMRKQIREEEEKKQEQTIETRKQALHALTGMNAVQSIPVNERMFERADTFERFLVNFNKNTQSILRTEGVHLRTLFNRYSKASFGFLNIEEFHAMFKYILNSEFDIAVSKAFFNIFITGFPKKMPFKTLTQIISVGQKVNSIFIKLKLKFKDLEKCRELFLEEFQRLDSKAGTGELSLNEIKEVFALNGVPLEDRDFDILKEENIVVTKKNQQFMPYQRFMQIVLADSNRIELTIQQNAAMKIVAFFRSIKKKKEQKLRQGLALPTSGGRASVKSKPTTRRTVSGTRRTKRSQPEKQVEFKEEEDKKTTKYKEVWEFEIQRRKPSTEKTPTQQQQQQQKPGVKGRAAVQRAPSKSPRRGGRNSKTQLTLEEKLNQALGELPKDQKAKERLDKVTAFCKGIVEGLFDKVIAYGESIVLSKEIQNKYQARPVVKDVFITLQELELEILDLLPRSLNFSTQTGRLGYMDKEGRFSQYDIANKQALRPISISSKVPLKKSKVIDFIFDDKSGRMYTLTDSWMLEVWELHQELSVPVSRVKIVADEEGRHAFAGAYLKRYMDVFPTFITLSKSTHQLLVINCTSVNNSIVLVDPVSLSVLSQSFLKYEDYKVTQNLSKTIHALKPHIENMQKKMISFEKLFDRCLVQKQKTFFIGEQDFIKTLTKSFELRDVTTEDLKQLFAFLDQNSDGEINLEELCFLVDLVRISAANKIKRKDDHMIPMSMQGLDEMTIKTLQKVNVFLKRSRLNLRDAFKIFDTANTGKVTNRKFIEILDQILEDITREEKEALVKAVDRDNSGTVEFEEFIDLFKDVEQFNVIQEMNSGRNPRTDIFFLIERAYQAGIDVETIFTEYDKLRQGCVTVLEFREILKKMPFGMLDSDVDYILQQEVGYMDNGRIDYMKIINNSLFTKAKFIAQLKDPKIEKKQIHKLLEKINADDYLFESQKIIIETIIYLDDFDIIIYTTSVPKTSTIFIASARREADQKSAPKEGETAKKDSRQVFRNKLLARLESHKSSNPPTIFYVQESGCLVSADKLDRKSEPTKRNILSDPGTNKESFNMYYTNIETSKQYSVDIIVWNLQRDLMALSETPAPWKILPSRIISNAHYDSVLDIAYMPDNQLIATCSLDKTIKIWDPVARPHHLNHPKPFTHVQTKPGVYAVPNEEHSQTNVPFTEVKRIYTGDQICVKLCAFAMKIPIPNLGGETGITGRIADYELLLTMNLSKAQLMEKTMKSPGFIRGYSCERMHLEIPSNRVDDVIPKRYYKELENLATEKRKKALFYLQTQLPMALESLKVKVVIQNANMKKISSMFKKLSLMKFDTDFDAREFDNYCRELFKTFVHLPFRSGFESFLAEAGLKDKLSISELFFYLKRMRQIHPLSITKEEFQVAMLDIGKRAKENLFGETSKTKNNLVKRISDSIKAGQLDFREELFHGDERRYVTSDIIKHFLETKKLYTNDKDAEELYSQLDPYYTNKINLQAVEEIFGSDIIDYKLNVYNRPNVLIKNMVSSLNAKQKMALLFAMHQCNAAGDGYLSKDECLKAFQQAEIEHKRDEVSELFELIAEQYSESDTKRYISLNFFSKRIFSIAENFEIMQMEYILGKLKAGLIFKQLHPQIIFLEYNADTKTYSKAVMQGVSKQGFVTRVVDLAIAGLQESEVKQLADFLAVVHPSTNQPYISAHLLSHYFRKLEIKYQFQSVSDIQRLYDVVSSLIAREDEMRRIYNSISKKSFGIPTLRWLLGEMKVDGDMIDELLVRFLEGDEVRFDVFVNKMRKHKEAYTILDDKDYLSVRSFTSSQYLEGDLKSALSPRSPLSLSPTKIDTPTKLSPTKKEGMFNVSELLKVKRADSPEVKLDEHVERLVQFLRLQGTSKLEELLQVCISFDFKKMGKIRVAVFVNILKYNVPDLQEEVLIHFQIQWERKKRDTQIEYHTFFDDHLLQKTKTSQPESEQNINMILLKAGKAMKSSEINVTAALSYLDQRATGRLSVDNLHKLFTWIKCDLDEKEKDTLLAFLKPDMSKTIDYLQFTALMDIASYDTSATYDFSTWEIASGHISKELLQKTCSLSNYLKFFVEKMMQELQEKKEVETPYSLPLISAVNFHRILLDLKHEFSSQEAKDIMLFSVIGSSPAPQEAKKRLAKVENIDPATAVIHFGFLIRSLDDFHAKQLESEFRMGPRQTTQEDKRIEAENLQVIGKIKGTLKDRDMSIWESILYSNTTINDESKISMNDFKHILNSLNLELTLKEKITLYRIVDPNKSGKVDLARFVDLLEEKGVNPRTIKPLLEKFMTSLFYNDLTIEKLFDQFDLDGSGELTKKEFMFGISQLDLGMSLLEVIQLMAIFDKNVDNKISRAEFLQGIEEYTTRFSIDPTQELVFGVYAKIQQLDEVRGMNLLEAFQELDIQSSGWVDFEGFKKALTVFGLDKLQPFQLSALLKFNKKPAPATIPVLDVGSSSRRRESKLDTTRRDSKLDTLTGKKMLTQPPKQPKDTTNYRDPDFKVYYKEFCDNLFAEVKTNAKFVIEATYDIARKVYYALGGKNISLFESFVFCDINKMQAISKLELKLGFKALGVTLLEKEFNMLWNALGKTKSLKVNYKSYIKLFISAGAVKVIKFDETVERLLKKFYNIIQKLGNFHEAYRKLDKNA